MLKRFAFRLLGWYRSLRLFFIKLRGKTEDDIHAQRIVSGKAWNEFCDSLKSAGASLVFNGTPRDPFNQAEGYRYLTRLTRAGLEAFIEYADPAFPILRRMVHETVKMGADNPDNYYQNAKISGEFTYKITGKRGSVHYLGFFTQKGEYGKAGGMAPSGFLESMDMEIKPNGTFEILMSTEKPPSGNWLPMEKESTLLIVRQTFLDREKETLADIKIEKIGSDAQPAPVTPKLIDEGLNSAALLVAGASMLFSKWAKDFQKHSNELPLFDPEVSNAAGGVVSIKYYHSHWKLAPDEALVIDANPPEDCDHWNFQLNNYWMESLDYRYYPVHVNKHTAHYREDGSVRIIVAHKDPGLGNWINTVGHQEGTMCFRWSNSQINPQPQTKIVKFEDLKQLD